MATATATRRPRVSAKKIAEKAAAEIAIRNSRMMFYTVTAYDNEGNVICVSDGVMTFENADCARDYMRRNFRPEKVIVSDEFGYTY